MPKEEKTLKNNPVAVIDIGSNEIRLRIAQISKGEVKTLETLSYPAGLGRDTYTSGEISFDKVESACSIIGNYKQIITGYGAKLYTVVASTSLRESKNREYVLDRIKIKTGVTVEILDDAEEKLHIFRLLSNLITEKEKKSSVMVYLGSGNLGLSFWENGKISLAKNIRMGSMRVSKGFENIRDYVGQYYKVVEEFLQSYTSITREDIQKENIKISNFITTGQEISMIAKLCGTKQDGLYNHISVKTFMKFYQEIKVKTVDRIADDYNLSIEKAEVLFPAMCIYKSLLEFLEVEEITTVNVYLTDALLFESLNPSRHAEVSKDFQKSSILFARITASKFNATNIHYTQIENVALDIFDKIRKIHGLGKKERILLQIAAILHGVGRYINEQNHHVHAYGIVSGIDLIGFSNIEKDIIANVVYYHSLAIPEVSHENYMNLSAENRVLVSKLAAILRIAASLDRSSKQKISSLAVKITDNICILTVSTNASPDLEKWSFNDKSKFFADVFGLKPILRIRRSE